MNFKAFDMGNCKGGEIIEIILKGDGVNVSIMDAPNYFEYKNGRKHKYIGGHVQSSPYKVMLPYDAHWYVAIDFGGYPGEAKCAVRKLSGKLPKLPGEKDGIIRVSTSGGSVDEEDIKSEFNLDIDTGYGLKEFDYFITYAQEKYKEIAQPLANAMAFRGKKICLEDFAMEKEDNLVKMVQKGFLQAKRGIIIISKEFAENGWLTYELDEILNLKKNDENLVTPVWHRVTKDEIIQACGTAFLSTMEYNTMTRTVTELIADLLNLELISEDVSRGESHEIPLIKF